MSGFASSWLALREPADHAARNAGLLARLADWAGGRELRIADLGCGTGSTWRAVQPVLGGSWTFVDADPLLLAEAAARHPAAVRQADLAAGVAQALPPATNLIVTSAFLDLVSAAWLDELAMAALALGAPVYAALSYNGQVHCLPAHPDDAAMFNAFDAHQRGDKGLGAALGPTAAAVAAQIFARHGFTVATAAADWRLGADQAELQRQLLDGWRTAIMETNLAPAGQVQAWWQARRAWIDQGAAGCIVGHTDMLALPPPRSQSNSTSGPNR